MPTPIDKNIEVVIYKNLAKPEELEFAKEKKEKPTDKDYKNGYMVRYFLRQENNPQAKILEVDKSQFNKFKNEAFYIKLDIQWKITGNVDSITNTNLNILNSAEEILPGIKLLLQNKLIEYARLI